MSQDSKTALLSLLLLLVSCVLLNMVASGLVIGTRFLLQDTVSWSTIAADPSVIPIGKLGLAVIHLMTFTGGAVLWYWLSPQKWSQLWQFFGLDKESDSHLTLAAVAITLLLLPVMAVTVAAMGQLDLPASWDVWDTDQTALLETILQMDGLGDFLVLLLVVAVLPAIGEELIFRGILQKLLVGRLGATVGIIATSVIFSAIHLQIMGFVPKLLIGLALGFVYYRTGHLFYPMLMHFVNNGMPVVRLYLGGDNLDAISDAEQADPTSMIAPALFSLVLLIFTLIYLIRSTTVDEREA